MENQQELPREVKSTLVLSYSNILIIYPFDSINIINITDKRVTGLSQNWALSTKDRLGYWFIILKLLRAELEL